MAFPRQRLGRPPIVLALAIGALVLALAGCGSSGEEGRTSGGGGEGSSSSTAQQQPDGVAAAKTDRKAAAEAGRPDEPGDGSARHAMHGSGNYHSSMHHRGGGAHHHQKMMDKGQPQCPGGTNKAECKARIEAQTGSDQAPGQAVSSPSECTQAMSEAQCKEILTAQKAAADEAGSSISPETCLKEYGREFCEKHFKQQYEQQQAGK